MPINRKKLFDFVEFHSIDYIDSGPNVAKNHINIKCPYCGNDPSYHMGINLNTGGYKCWRSASHRGKDASFLLAKVTHLSATLISKSIGTQVLLTDDDMDKALNILNGSSTEFNKKEIRTGVEELDFYKSFVPISGGSHHVQPAINYLRSRGFEDVEDLANYYNLQYSYYGDWNYRIIFPVYVNEELMTWVGRSISNKTILPYKDLSIEESVLHCKSCLFNYDRLTNGGDTLYITEGVFDALKIDWFAVDGVRATCLFTKTMTDDQLESIYSLKDKFKKVVVLLDNDAIGNALDITHRLRLIANSCTGMLPDKYKDPGSIPGGLIMEELLSVTETSI